MFDEAYDVMPDVLIKILGDYHHIAVVGLSAKPRRPSREVSAYMQEAGYNIIPINPLYAGQQILGQRVYATLADAAAAGEQIEIVNVFRRPEQTPPFADEAASVGARALWLQLGIANDETKRRALAAGLLYVENRCIKVEHARLFGGLSLI
ncbi:CoA-binding protein [Dictyobacter formicarum]|uniref:CoA-binding protein n=1 Tax=Dictyobacter formicarum TaxID=2778368 RepID=A0ABQ3VCS0_9CHLR|nr:CoA-binding protein [Dictyobacter formicarum]GHO83707.1 CoA-binding protein [Dictyobacter formicarum]